MKSILDLCRLLPNSEPEIRERENEFNEAVRLATEPETTGRQYLRCISDAKAATDTMIARGFWVGMSYTPPFGWQANFTLFLDDEDDDNKIDVTVETSTEELARSAAALLAAEAMKEKI